MISKGYCTQNEDLVASSRPNAFPPSRQSTPHANKKIHEEDHHDDHQDHQLGVLPPHPPTQPPAADPEVMRIPSQPIRLVNEQINPLPTLQHPFNILRHDPPHIVDIPLGQRERIRR